MDRLDQNHQHYEHPVRIQSWQLSGVMLYADGTELGAYECLRTANTGTVNAAQYRRHTAHIMTCRHDGLYLHGLLLDGVICCKALHAT